MKVFSLLVYAFAFFACVGSGSLHAQQTTDHLFSGNLEQIIMGLNGIPYRPDGATDPTCASDPCLCGWCDDEKSLRRLFGLTTPHNPDLLSPSIDRDALKFDKPEHNQPFKLEHWQPGGATKQGLKGYPFRPDGLPDPTCGQDACQCGWCKNKDLLRRYLELSLNSSSKPIVGKVDTDLIKKLAEAQFLPTAESAVSDLEINKQAHDYGLKLVENGSFCPDQKRRPIQVTREGFLTRKNANTCTKTVEKMDAFHERLLREYGSAGEGEINRSKRIFWPRDIFNPIMPEAVVAEAREVYFDYADKCLNSFTSVSDPNANRHTSNSNFLKISSVPGTISSIRNSIGVLRTPNSNNEICSAAIVDIYGKNHLVAAMHCLGKEKNTDELGFEGVWSDLEFTSLAGMKLDFKVAKEVQQVSFERLREDVFAFELDNNITGPLLSLSPLSLEPWEPMMIIGHNVYLEALARSSNVLADKFMAGSMNVQVSADCTARTLDRGLLRYRCQTEKGSSGAPILAWRDGKYVLAGLHLGAKAGKPEPLSCKSGQAQGGANRGIALRLP